MEGMQPQMMPMLSSSVLESVRKLGVLKTGGDDELMMNDTYSHMICSARTQVWSLFSSVWMMMTSRMIVVTNTLGAVG